VAGCRLGADARAAPVVLDAILGLAGVRAQHGDSALAYQWSLFALAHPASAQETQDRAKQLSLVLETRLAPAEAEAARGQAGTLTLEALVAQVLE
jgi:hypothetical protein